MRLQGSGCTVQGSACGAFWFGVSCLRAISGSCTGEFTRGRGVSSVASEENTLIVGDEGFFFLPVALATRSPIC